MVWFELKNLKLDWYEIKSPENGRIWSKKAKKIWYEVKIPEDDLI